MKSAPNFSVFAAFENEGVNRVGGLQHIDVEEGMAGQSGNLEVMTDQRFFRISCRSGLRFGSRSFMLGAPLPQTWLLHIERGFSQVPNMEYGNHRKPKFLCGIVLSILFERVSGYP